MYNPDFDEVRSYVRLESNPALLGVEHQLIRMNTLDTRIIYGDFVFRIVSASPLIAGSSPKHFH